jgi:hypothetical protein
MVARLAANLRGIERQPKASSFCSQILYLESGMNRNHWVMLIVVAAIFYIVGVKFPSFGASTLAKVGV